MTALVEVDVGSARCGVPANSEATALAKMIAASRHLRFGGLQAYHGAAQHKRTPEERRAGIADAINAVAALVDDLKKAGLDCAIVGGAGTGTFELEARSGALADLGRHRLDHDLKRLMLVNRAGDKNSATATLTCPRADCRGAENWAHEGRPTIEGLCLY